MTGPGTAPPPHYRAFRYVLVGVLVLVLVGLVVLVTDPVLLALILEFLGVD